MPRKPLLTWHIAVYADCKEIHNVCEWGLKFQLTQILLLSKSECENKKIEACKGNQRTGFSIMNELLYLLEILSSPTG